MDMEPKKLKHIGDTSMLPLEIISDILIRLPAKLLGRLRCVSKSWNMLLRDPHFVHMHLNRAKHNRTNIKLMAHSDEPNYLRVRLDRQDLSVEIRFSDVRVCGSCNGLLLLCQGHPRRDEDICLFNPTTGERKIIQAPLSENLDDLEDDARYGFCYSEYSKDYKIVRIRSYIDETGCPIPAEITTYSLNENLWKKVYLTDDKHTPVIDDLNIFRHTGVPVNGYLHWLAYSREGVSHHGNPKIIAFDVERECFQDVLYPPSCNSSNNNAEICSLNGSLCLMRQFESKWQVWVMKEYGLVESWTEMFRIDDQLLPHGENTTARLLCYVNKGEDVLFRNREDLCVYNIKNQIIHRIYRFYSSYARASDGKYRATLYTESLFPLGASR